MTFLTKRLRTCPECDHVSNEWETIEHIVVVRCHECDHIWATLDMSVGLYPTVS